MPTKNATQIQGLLQTVVDDCEMQLKALREKDKLYNETSWDVLDEDNWEAMADSLRKAAKLLHIKLR